ncbi:amidohydrolase [Verrucomicrobiaceae bacterium 5K15]|uniref:Amidohydrolase n=1 Tax=Oceaniferula flava TaxID=2800421 RepID=A0AAE2VBS2_9BACT|nr:amidohydrolase family protein [Oceaniferula flavus]MBK1854835.1 amidohydrolase [Oceaniferula flavus]MBM1136141.1 amidohydrolase [Oceaniferula flavus]
MIDAHVEVSSENLSQALEELENDIEFSGVDQVIAIQRHPDAALNAPLLELAKASDDLIAGCVTWIPLHSPKIKAYLDEDTHRPNVVAYQESIASAEDLQDADFSRGVQQVTLSGKPLELFMSFDELGAMIQFADQHPGQAMIADFGASIDPASTLPKSGNWARLIRELARRPHIYIRLSSLTPLLQGETAVAQSESLLPYFDTLLSAFGPQRILFGSGWPHALGPTNYPTWLSTVDNLIHALSDAEKRAVYHHNAATFYQLNPPE